MSFGYGHPPEPKSAPWQLQALWWSAALMFAGFAIAALVSVYTMKNLIDERRVKNAEIQKITNAAGRHERNLEGWQGMFDEAKRLLGENQ